MEAKLRIVIVTDWRFCEFWIF